MRKLMLVGLSAGLLATTATSVAAQVQGQPMLAEMEEVEFDATVVDLSCRLVYNLSGEQIHRQCAQVCADQGIPLGLLSDDGTFYLPVSLAMPAESSNAQLRPHAEHHVHVKGKKLTRAGLSSIVIESITM